MELLSVTRQWHRRNRVPICEIERRTGLSRNTIRKYLRSDAVEVRFKVPERPSRLNPFADKLSEWLRVEAGKGRKGRRTVVSADFRRSSGRIHPLRRLRRPPSDASRCCSYGIQKRASPKSPPTVSRTTAPGRSRSRTFPAVDEGGPSRTALDTGASPESPTFSQRRTGLLPTLF